MVSYILNSHLVIFPIIKSYISPLNITSFSNDVEYPKLLSFTMYGLLLATSANAVPLNTSPATHLAERQVSWQLICTFDAFDDAYFCGVHCEGNTLARNASKCNLSANWGRWTYARNNCDRQPGCNDVWCGKKVDGTKQDAEKAEESE